MRISIVLATFNGEDYLPAQLESYAAQLRLPDELVVCDDRSTDATSSILAEFAQRAPFPVRLVQNERTLGASENFAQALALATGDVIFLSDQDDVWLPRKLARMVEEFADEDVFVACCDQALADADLNLVGQTTLQRIRMAGTSREMWAVGCCTAVRATLRPAMLPVPAGMPHDTWIDMLASSLGVKRTVPEVLQYHRRHGTNTSSDVLNPLSRVTRWELMRRQIGASTEENYGWQLAQFETLVQRLHDVSSRKLPGHEKAREGSARAERKLATMKERIRLARRPRYARLSGVLRLLRSGGYAQFSGWKSAVKDLLDPRTG
jgi:glycosyltransferase involved in cell wall biosynthesis